MDTSSIAGSALFMKLGQTQQALSTSMIKQSAEQQNKMANLLAQNARQAPQPAAGNGSSFNFSTYA